MVRIWRRYDQALLQLMLICVGHGSDTSPVQSAIFSLSIVAKTADSDGGGCCYPALVVEEWPQIGIALSAGRYLQVLVFCNLQSKGIVTINNYHQMP